MKLVLFISFLSLFLSCGFKDSKFVRKKIGDNAISIKWYYYSYITNNSPDVVEVEKDREIKEIYKGDRVILDVAIKDHCILLKLVQPSNGYPETKKVSDEVFGYKILVDTTGVSTDLNSIPDGIKE